MSRRERTENIGESLVEAVNALASYRSAADHGRHGTATRKLRDVALASRRAAQEAEALGGDVGGVADEAMRGTYRGLPVLAVVVEPDGVVVHASPDGEPIGVIRTYDALSEALADDELAFDTAYVFVTGADGRTRPATLDEHERHERYVVACENAERAWGPLVAALASRGITARVEQTGGMVFCVVATVDGATCRDCGSYHDGRPSNYGHAFWPEEVTWSGNGETWAGSTADGSVSWSTDVPSSDFGFDDPRGDLSEDDAERLADAFAASFYATRARLAFEFLDHAPTPGDQFLRCGSCGWSFTLHGVPDTAAYRDTSYTCPHCGRSVDGPSS